MQSFESVEKVFQKEKYVIYPQKRRFGWSDYILEITIIDNSRMYSQETIMLLSGKKLFIFGLLVWDYKDSYKIQK